MFLQGDIYTTLMRGPDDIPLKIGQGKDAVFIRYVWHQMGYNFPNFDYSIYE